MANWKVLPGTNITKNLEKPSNAHINQDNFAKIPSLKQTLTLQTQIFQHLGMRCILNIDTSSKGDCQKTTTLSHPLALVTNKSKSRSFRSDDYILSSFYMKRHTHTHTHKSKIRKHMKHSKKPVRTMWNLPASSLSYSSQSRTSGTSNSVHKVCCRKWK